MKTVLKTGKSFFRPVFLTFICISAFSQVVQAQDATSQTQEFDVTIDKLGDANLVVSTKMTQAQWEGFKQGPLVNDPSISKRNMERSMSTYVLEDFKRDIDDMNRTVKMSLKVKAMATYKGNGHWEYQLGVKNPLVTKLPDNSMMITSNTNLNGQLVEQIWKISFPGGASNIQETTDSFGKALFTYNYGGGIMSFLTWNLILGVLLIICAVIVYFRSGKPTSSGGFNININKRIASPQPITNLPPSSSMSSPMDAPHPVSAPQPVNTPPITNTPPPANLPPHV